MAQEDPGTLVAPGDLGCLFGLFDLELQTLPVAPGFLVDLEPPSLPVFPEIPTVPVDPVTHLSREVLEVLGNQ